MPPPPHPADDRHRLDALRASGLLESGSMPELDAIVRRAAQLCGTPVVAITLLDDTSQHFKASVGLGIPHMSRDESFCGYAILEHTPLIVLDARSDPRFADNPLVLAHPGVRFYAGAVVYGPSRYPFGALCGFDTTARTGISGGTVRALRSLASEVTAIFARRTPLAEPRMCAPVTQAPMAGYYAAGPSATQSAITSSE